MKESKFSAKALMLCPICKNSYYSELEVTVPENFRDMKEINTAKDNNGDIVHLDICSSAAPIKKDKLPEDFDYSRTDLEGVLQMIETGHMSVACASHYISNIFEIVDAINARKANAD